MPAKMPSSAVLGYFVEGVVEQDPMDDRYLIRTVDSQGRPVQFDVLDALSRMVGKEVRLTLNSFENLAELERLVRESGQDVLGIRAEDIPGVPKR